MSQLLMRTQNVLLYLLILAIGLYAGMLFFHEMCPVETQLTALEYAAFWKIVDGTFMHHRMSIMGPLMLGLFVLNIVFNIKQWRSVRFLLLSVSFALFVADVSFTMSEQMPINAFINELNLEQMSDTEMSQLKTYQLKSIQNFHNRFALGFACFATLCLVVFYKKPAGRKKTMPSEPSRRRAVFQ